jgi:flagellar biosynthesis/type III secretory pathway protein FliH
MIAAEFTHEEVQSLIQSLEAERDQYFKDYGSNRFSFVREIAERVVEQNNQIIHKLELLIGEGVPF